MYIINIVVEVDLESYKSLEIYIDISLFIKKYIVLRCCFDLENIYC